MKIKLGNYFVVGGFGQKPVFISKDYKLPYYVSTKELETKGAGLSIPAGATFAVTVLLRYIDSQNRQANLFLLVLGLLMIYFSVEWIFRGYPNIEHEVEEYTFQSEEELFSFVRNSRKRNHVLIKFYLVFLAISVVLGLFYFVTNLFVCLFLSLGMFLCWVLMAKYQPIKRMFVLNKIKKEVIR